MDDMAVRQLRQIAIVQAAVARALIEMEAMKAENWMRDMKGQTIAYGEDAFLEILERHGIGENGVISTLNLV